MSRYKKLAKNSVIFAIGNLGSKLITLLLVPLYTFYLSTEQFGVVDLVGTTLSMLVPIFTLSIFEAVLRFVMDKNYDKKVILNNALILTMVGFVISLLLYPVLQYILPFSEFLYLFYILLFTQSINNTILQFIRAIGKVKLYASFGIITALLILILNIIFLIVFDLGEVGYLLSLIIADVISILTVVIIGKIYKYINLKSINTKIIKEMLIYSMPLIPNALMWWVMGLSDRYLITYFLGFSANGIYAIANKLPNVLNIVNSIFFQAWQMSAIEEVNSKDKSEFFSKVFNAYSTLLFLCASIFLVLIKPLIGFLIAPEYSNVWRYIPFLLMGIIFSSFSGFLGTNYIALKKTTGVFRTSVLGAFINLFLNIILIPKFGINGASFSTMISFSVIWIVRTFETKKFITLKIRYFTFIPTIILLYLQIYILYCNISYEFMFLFLIVIIIIILNLKEIYTFVRILLKRKSKS
ncbi:oligosaccharide flippase family protein [Cytobacillus oceanisediminis]|uniref:oligosaccharide flippase family protein n=1 Tax=Cytobacillus oceanisediminis TaxID=665099 RepID=UPI001CCCD46B|nr:oligosaccharide flippase family protein [Cytobacillus oceanisediminis]MBZ9536853.1 oligosaccharide flippase family protein [Cytobacillus oceanisediminis]